MILSDILKKSNILINARSQKPAALFDELLNLAVKNGEIELYNLEAIKSTLVAREKLKTSGIGKGIALPHCLSSKVDKPVVMFTTIKDGINFAAIDDKPVYIVVLLVFPENMMSFHIKVLVEIAQMMNDNGLVEKLKGLKDSDSVLKTIKNYNDE